MSKNKKWIITTGGDRPLADIAKDLAAAGLEGGKTLDEVGCVMGSAQEHCVPKLRKVRGVVDVSPDTPIDVGPPDSPTTW